MKRRLAAILAGDVVGYSAMVQRDDLRAMQTVKGHISAFEPHIALHDGSIFKTMGDGFLAEFSSVIEAVECAAVLQRTAAERNRRLGHLDQAVFRIGVHSGDVIEDEGDIFGDGVNIASRLEGIATPGKVAISARVFEEINGRLDLAFTDRGLQTLKNIEKPVQVYEVASCADPVLERPLNELPDKPSIAILPLQSLSIEGADDFLADGLTEDLTTALSGVPWLFVIARNSAFTYKGLAADVRRVGRELGVKYVVEGSVRSVGNRVRISAQLVNALDGKTIWADRFDGELDDVFDLQDRIANETVKAVAPKIQMAEIRNSARKRPEDRTAYDLYLGALNHLYCARVEDADTLLRRAIEVSPDYASAKAILAWCTTLQVSWHASKKETLREAAIGLCSEALDSPRRDVETEAYCGYALAFHMLDIDRGMSLVAGAVEQCPNFAWAWVSRSFLESFFGDARQALEFGNVALRLNPRDPLVFRTFHCITTAYAVLGEHQNALDAACEGLKYNSNILNLQVEKVLALARLNRMDEAKTEASNLLLRHPGFRVSRFVATAGQFRSSFDAERDLKASGLPE